MSQNNRNNDKLTSGSSKSYNSPPPLRRTQKYDNIKSLWDSSSSVWSNESRSAQTSNDKKITNPSSSNKNSGSEQEKKYK